MLRKIRKSHSVRVVSAVLAIQMFISSIGIDRLIAANNVLYKNNTYAVKSACKYTLFDLLKANGLLGEKGSKLSGKSKMIPADGGPDLPEAKSFEPVGTNQMVDLFTGDFTYNIPLFNIPGPDGGYPINIAYHSGVSMEQEASWVGLGWNINMGTINRQLRNLPDDFGGDVNNKEVHVKTDMRPDWTVGAGAHSRTEIFGFDKAGVQTGGVTGSLSYGLSLFYNNYKGIGYSLDAGFNLGLGKKPKDGTSQIMGDLGFDLSLNSQEGVNSKYSMGLHSTDAEKGYIKNSASVSTGFNSRTGWQRSLEISAYTRQKMKKYIETANYSGGTSISFSNMPTQLSIPYAMRGGSGSISFGAGPEFAGLFKKTNFSANFQYSVLRDRKDNKTVNTVDYTGVGYMYFQRNQDAGIDLEKDFRIKDFSRENDGLIHKHSRTLATPTLSYDVYSVTGQGIGNMFRPFRDDIGLVVAPKVKSEFHGGSIGIEKGTSLIPTDKWFGIDAGYNFSSNVQDAWPNTNNKPNTLSFTNVGTNIKNPSLTEDVYFQNYGEQTTDDIAANYGASVAAERPVTYELAENNNFYDVLDMDRYTSSVTDVKQNRTTRKRRAKDIEAFTNEMMMDVSYTTTIIPEFKLKYYSSPSASGYNPTTRADFDTDIRKNLSKTHVGGYAALNESGMRYNYALPAMNNVEKDVTFSVKELATDVTQTSKPLSLSAGVIDYKIPGTNKYYNSVQKDKYAHSYLLTSILGTDYVDLDNIVGPSDGDKGYWVRCDYTLAHSDFQWKSPYKDAMYNKGFETSFTDGTGSYSYGKKDVWYVATVETQTHVAEFILSDRKDAREAGGELDNAPGSKHYKKLDKINIYVKSERYPGGVFDANAKPVQTCNFVYDYSLCPNSPDNEGNQTLTSNEVSNGGGKLTLKKIYFTYRNNQSGATRPYTFEYNTGTGANGSGTISYSRYDVDRWGNYQPAGTVLNTDYPYVSPYTTKAEMDSRAGLWNVKAINLPSGGRYEVDYESDSYAYVQDEVAMQMFTIKSMDPYSSTRTAFIDHNKDDVAAKRNVYFELEQPIPTTKTTQERQAIMDRYIKAGEYIYFKVKINMTKDNSATDYVGAYVKVSDVKVDVSSVVGSNYVWGYVQLDLMKENGKLTNFHPFTEAGARHLKYNQADLLYDNPPNADKDKLSKSDVKNLGWSLISNVTDIKDLFMDFTNMIYSGGNGRCTHIDLDKSYLRMRTPDKIKYGGGHRVKEVRVIDNWSTSVAGAEASSTYGTVYDYNMIDPITKETISAGVAAYEPLVGGDEIPLRNPVKGWEDKNLTSKTSATTYSEDPGNESLYPGPTVGYRQVRVMSKVTADKIATPTNSTVNYSGITIHEFYTAKDFPVINERSELQQNGTFKKSRLLIPAIVVNVDRMRMAASQGYYLELNNMHGQPLSSTEIGFDEQGKEQEISNVRYEYFDDGGLLTTNDAGESIVTRKLKNQVDVMFADLVNVSPYNSDIRSSTIATEVEFIPEERYIESKNISAGLQFNLKINTPLVFFFPIPTFSWKEEKTGTIVTNKIVNKTAITKAVIATQKGATIRTDNLVFDDMTGQPLLTSVTNEYGNLVYNYSIMANEQYEGTRGSYQNIGYATIGSILGSLSNGIQRISLSTATEGDNLFPGDVLIAMPVTQSGSTYLDDNTRAKLIVVFNQKNAANDFAVEARTALTTGLYRFTVIRSGRRNLLAMPISNITALSNPTTGRTKTTCTDSKDIGTPQTFDRYFINNVVDINAIELGSNWYKDTRQLQTIPSTWNDNTFFSRGFSGVYAPIRPYAYVDDRTQTGAGVNLEIDGVMNNVELFNWERKLAVCPTKWKMTEQITLKNASSADIESKNILGTYSAKLFGDNGTEPIAVAGNAKNTEIGFESFEEYVTGTQAITQNGTTNLNFYTTNTGTRTVEDRFDVSNGYGVTTTQTGTVDIPLTAVSGTTLIGYSTYTLRMHFDGTATAPSKEVLLRVSPTFSIASGKVTMTFTDASLAAYNNNRWRGELFAQKTIPSISAANNATVKVAAKGHSGDRCLNISGTGNSPEFLQEKLVLILGNEYQFTGWYSTPDNNYLLRNSNTLFLNNFVVNFYSNTGALISSSTFTESQVLQGDFIEDWQKFSMNFTVPAGTFYTSVVLPKAPTVADPVLGTNVNEAYYDDLRIQPLDGGMQAYVYNQQNQRLEAVLDGNNYATFYYYDDEGNLFLVKQETEKGIITKQESRTYIRKTN